MEVDISSQLGQSYLLSWGLCNLSQKFSDCKLAVVMDRYLSELLEWMQMIELMYISWSGKLLLEEYVNRGDTDTSTAAQLSCKSMEVPMSQGAEVVTLHVALLSVWALSGKYTKAHLSASIQQDCS